MNIWTPGMSLDDVEQEVVNQAYQFFNKNSEAAAKSLQIDLDNFNEKMENFKLKSEKIKQIIDREKKKERDHYNMEKQRLRECYNEEGIRGPVENRIV